MPFIDNEDGSAAYVFDPSKIGEPGSEEMIQAFAAICVALTSVDMEKGELDDEDLHSLRCAQKIAAIIEEVAMSVPPREGDCDGGPVH